MVNIHLLNSERLAEGIEVSYKDGLLSEIKFPTKFPLTLVQHVAFLKHIPYSEDLLEFNMGLIKISVQPQTPHFKKIALWCGFYHTNRGLQYKITEPEKRKLKELKVTEEILTAYYKSTAFEIMGKEGTGKHSVNNFYNYYNLILQEMAAGDKKKYPDTWSEGFQNKLTSQQELTEYWGHLRTLGLEPKKDRTGKTLDWVKKE